MPGYTRIEDLPDLDAGNNQNFDAVGAGGDDEYRQHFRELRAYHVMNGMILSHIPIHPESLGRFGTNIHGHLHANRVMAETWGKWEIDPRYHLSLIHI